MRLKLITLVAALLLAACAKPKPLTPEIADALVRRDTFAREPVYAEVPQKVWYGPKSPKDDFDELSLRTLDNLQKAGLVSVTQSTAPDGMTTVQAKVTEKGFPILGTMPSMRGPVYRGRICEKILDGTKNFIRHPNNPTVGRAEVVWHYDNPTPLYPLFETKRNKPLKKPFVSLASFYWAKGAFHVDLVVKKADG